MPVGMIVGIVFVVGLVVGAIWVALNINWWFIVLPMAIIIGAGWWTFTTTRRSR